MRYERPRTRKARGAGATLPASSTAAIRAAFWPRHQSWPQGAPAARAAAGAKDRARAKVVKHDACAPAQNLNNPTKPNNLKPSSVSEPAKLLQGDYNRITPTPWQGQRQRRLALRPHTYTPKNIGVSARFLHRGQFGPLGSLQGARWGSRRPAVGLQAGGGAGAPRPPAPHQKGGPKMLKLLIGLTYESYCTLLLSGPEAYYFNNWVRLQIFDRRRPAPAGQDSTPLPRPCRLGPGIWPLPY
jgi:hypothetical protein